MCVMFINKKGETNICLGIKCIVLNDSRMNKKNLNYQFYGIKFLV
jgi:hypothetical protein